MPRGYRLVIIAAFGIALVSAAANERGLAPKGIGNGQATSESATGAKPQQPTTQTSAAPKAPETPSADTGCPDGKDRRHSDLCAQWKAADAAFDSARAAEWQTVINWIGLALGFITMAAAIAAAYFAKEAASHTRDGNSLTKATEDAYLVVDISDGTKLVTPIEDMVNGAPEMVDVHYVQFSLIIKNIGRSAAHIHHITANAERMIINVTIEPGRQETFHDLIQHYLDGPPPCRDCGNGTPIPPLSISVEQSTRLSGHSSQTFRYYVRESKSGWYAYVRDE